MGDTNIDNLVKDKLLRMQLTNIRKSKNMTQNDVAKLSGLSASCISNIESGEMSSPTVRSLIKYATAIGVEIYINLEPDKQPSNNDRENIQQS